MGVVESLPSSTGIHEYQHNRRYIFGARRKSVCASSSDGNGSLLAPEKSLKCATVCLSNGKDGVLYSTNSGTEEPPVLSLRPRSRTRSRLRDSLRRHSLWQLSSSLAPPRQDSIPSGGNGNDGMAGSESIGKGGGKSSDYLATMSPPLQRSLLSASMPNLPTRQPRDNAYEGSDSGDPATYTDDSDSSSDENKAYSLGSSISNDGETTDTAQPPIKQSSGEDAPVDRPKSRRRLDPRVIGKYLSHRLSSTSSTPSQKSRDAAVEEKDGAATTGCTDNGWLQSVPAEAMLPGLGGGLVQLNTDFEKLGVCYDDLADKSKSGFSETTRTTPWLFLLKDTVEEPLFVQSLEKRDRTSGGDSDDLASFACDCNP
ncbi:hypothetical protein LPJ59_006407, partial [Coemansia sp. RSA 2399]